MTNEQIAERIYMAYAEHVSGDGEEFIAFVIKELQAVRAAERERCVLVCEQEAEDAGSVFGEWQDGAFACAAAIRALD